MGCGMRRAARKDRNHNEITAVFQKAGFRVWDTSQLGGGFPDIIIARNKSTGVVEIKDGKLKPSARRLTLDETCFRIHWETHGRWYLVASVDDALNVIEEW